ncbi:single-stranded DNA-binding protein [Staphylococcus lutrae]|nr:single-stranded DNA-binding protein [Staphylococcus lutrae]
MNHFQIVGHIQRPPKFYENEARYFIIFTVAVTRNDLSKSPKPITDYLNCKAFGNIALQINETITEGMTVAMSGQIQSRRFYQNDEKRYATELLVSEISPILASSPTIRIDTHPTQE